MRRYSPWAFVPKLVAALFVLAAFWVGTRLPVKGLDALSKRVGIRFDVIQILRGALIFTLLALEQ